MIDALQRPDVLDGSKWIALPLPDFGGRRHDYTLPSQTIGVDPVRKRMYWCDGHYDERAICPSHFSIEAVLSLPQLLGECTIVDAADGAEGGGR